MSSAPDPANVKDCPITSSPRVNVEGRIDEAARYAPVERLALSPQCGFASTAAGNLLTEDEQWRQLEPVVETARRVWR